MDIRCSSLLLIMKEINNGEVLFSSDFLHMVSSPTIWGLNALFGDFTILLKVVGANLEIAD